MDTDLELLERWREGDKVAGGRLLTRYFNPLRSFFSARVPELDQQDLIQEVFARMISARDRFEGRSSLRTYLFQIARHVYCEALRKRYRSGGGFDELSESVADLSGRSLSSILSQSESLQFLLDGLRQIPVMYQDVLELHYFHELSYVDIAAIIEIPVETVRTRALTARKKLRERYNALSTGALDDDAAVERALTQVRGAVERAELRPPSSGS